MVHKRCQIPLECMKHTLTKQREVCSAIHGSFEQFELVDLAFHLTIGVHYSESSQYRIFVSFKSFRKPLHFGESTLGNLLFPVFEPMAFAFAYDLSKGLDEGVQRGKVGAGLTQLLEVSSLIFVQMIKRTSDEPERLLNRDAVHNGEGWKLDGFLLERLEKTIDLFVRSTIS